MRVLQSGPGHYTVIDEPTGIFGAGESVVDAFRDFAAAMTEHRDVLERQEQLGPELAWQLKYLRERQP